MSFNPFHQFEVHKVVDLAASSLDFSFTNSGFFMLTAVAAIVGFYFLAFKNPKLIPNRLQSSGEILYEFIENTLIGTSGEKSRDFVPFIFSIFCFVFTLNLLGMLPYGFTVTSQIIVNFSLASIIFLIVIVVGFIKHGLHFLKLFLPDGTPLIMAPMIIIIELLSFLARPITLTLRLAGNMIAGHVLLKVLASFVVMMGLWGFLPIPFIVILSGFEYFVAILQAYIFTLLSCVYLNDAINLH